MKSRLALLLSSAGPFLRFRFPRPFSGRFCLPRLAFQSIGLIHELALFASARPRTISAAVWPWIAQCNLFWTAAKNCRLNSAFPS